MKTLMFIKPADEKLTAAQPRSILYVLESRFGPNVAVRIEDFGRALAQEPTFVSKQDPALVVAYHCRKLADGGYVDYQIIPDAELVEIPPAPTDIFADEAPAPTPPKPKAGGKGKSKTKAA